MWRRTWYSVFSAEAESVTTKRFSFWNANGNEKKILKHPPRLWSQQRAFQRRCDVFDSTCLLFALSHKHVCGHSHFLFFFFLFSSQVNTARLRLMIAVPSLVSTTEHVLTYWGATHATVLQVRGHITCDTWLLYSRWERASADLLNLSVADVAWSTWLGALRQCQCSQRWLRSAAMTHLRKEVGREKPHLLNYLCVCVCGCVLTVTNNTAVIRTEHGQLWNSQKRQPGHTHKNHQFRLGYDWQLEGRKTNIQSHCQCLTI